jgi:hypothetical protein
MGTRSLHGLATPRPLDVITTPDGIPHAINVQGRRRLVVAIREDWLVQDRWWTSEPVDRHYYELLLEPGRVMTLYRETREGAWYHH